MRLLTFAIICTACYYLLARAEVTRWFWQPWDGTWIGRMFRCPACTGTWVGAVLGHVIPVNGHVHDVLTTSCLITTARHALYGMVLTAITWALMKVALDYGSVPEDADAQADRKPDPEGQPPSEPDR